MNKSDVLTYFGTAATVAAVLGISRAAVSLWPDVIPELRAIKLERITGGELRYDPTLYRRTAA